MKEETEPDSDYKEKIFIQLEGGIRTWHKTQTSGQQL